jgi:hypothetical protein
MVSQQGPLKQVLAVKWWYRLVKKPITNSGCIHLRLYDYNVDIRKRFDVLQNFSRNAQSGCAALARENNSRQLSKRFLFPVMGLKARLFL